MSSVLLSNAPLGRNNRSSSSQSNTTPTPIPQQPTPTAPPTKSFRQMVRASLQETLKSAKPKGKGKVLDVAQTTSIANQASFAASLGMSTSTSKLLKEKGKAKDTGPRRSLDNTSSQINDERNGGIKRLPSVTFFKKNKDAANDRGAPTSSRTRLGSAWPFASPSQPTGTLSTPSLHLASDATATDTQEAQKVSSSTSAGALVSPQRSRRPTVSSRASGDSGSSPTTARKQPASPGTPRHAPPSPPTLVLASSSRNARRVPPSPSTPNLPTSPNDLQPQTPPRGIIRRSTDQPRTPSRTQSPTTYRRSEEDTVRSGSLSAASGSGSGSRSPSPATTRLGVANGRRPSARMSSSSPSPTPRRSSDRRPSFEQRPKPYTSMSTSNLPLGAGPSAIPSHHSPLRAPSHDRTGRVPSPIYTGQTTSTANGFYHRRNSSSTSFRASSPPTNGDARTGSPVYRTHGRNTSTSSLLGGSMSTISPQREAMRAAASFVIKEMTKPPVGKTSTTLSPHGGLASAPAGLKIDPWDEVELRLQALARLERMWGRSGHGSGFASMANSSSTAVNSAAGATVSSGREESERKTFCDALKDGYVLAQLMNKLNPTSPLPIPRVDPREDGLSKTSNLLKFRDAAREFITRSGPEGKDLLRSMIRGDELAEGNVEAVARVSKLILILASLKAEGVSGQSRWISRRNSGEESTSSRASLEREPSSLNGSATLTHLSRSTGTTTSRKGTAPAPASPAPAPGRRSFEASTDSPTSSALAERRLSSDRLERMRRLGPSPSTPPPGPPHRPSLSERRPSGSQQSVPLAPPSPPPPRSALRTVTSFGSTNRTSVASSAQTNTTDQTGLFDHRLSNKFGTIRTMNTIATDATSIHPDGSVNGSWGREEAQNVVLTLGLAESLEGSAPVPLPRRKSYDFKGGGSPSASGLALALQQSHPPVASAEYLQDGGLRPRRDRRSSEVAADLTRVLEETTTDIEGSVKHKTRRESEVRPPLPTGPNLRKGMRQEDLNALPESAMRTPLEPPIRAQVTPPLDNSFGSSSGGAVAGALSSSPERDGTPVQDAEVTPKVKHRLRRSTPITIVTAASPHKEKSQEAAFAPPVRRPSHRAASQSVDVLLPRTHERRISVERRVSGERRISLDRRVSAERFKGLHDRDSSSGSGEGPQPLADSPLPRSSRRSITRSSSASRRAVYYPGRSTTADEPSPLSSGLPSSPSVPAVSNIRVPFPRSFSGEHMPPPPEAAAAEVTRPAPSPFQDPELATPTKNRTRYQSDLETPRLIKRGSSGMSGVSISMQRRGSAGAEEHHNMAGRSRYESMHNIGGMPSSTSLARMSSTNGSRMTEGRRTIIVREEGKAPMHYQLGNCIGKGQFGSVYRALNLGTGQMMAVKRIRLEGLPESEVTQLMKEVDLLKQLKHPSIVSYEGMVRDEDSLDIVLEYVENGSLGQTVKSFGKFNEKLVAQYVIKILEGLHYLHEQRVVHCDLKAANILSTKNGNIKLSDFGVSLALNAMESAMEKEKENVAGTPNWMAPEVIELKGATTASDIWSLGCTIVELLTGRPPYSDIGNSLSVMYRIVDDDQPPIPEECSDLLRDFLVQCFKKDPAQRPTAELLFEHPWLKKSWGLNKDLRPDDSVPFLRRVSTDLQARQISIQNLAETAQAQAQEAAVKTNPDQGSPAEPEFTVKPHTFVKTSFRDGAVMCRICHEMVQKSAAVCGDCSLICHSSCIKDAPAHCDYRAQFLMYQQYLNSHPSNGSPNPSTPNGVSPSLPVPPSPIVVDHALSGSPGFSNKLFNWKRTSKTSITDSIGAPHSPIDGSQRRSGGLLFPRRSEDRSRSRRESIHGGSQHSSSSRSNATPRSQGSTYRGTNELGRKELRASAITFASDLQSVSQNASPVAAPIALPGPGPSPVDSIPNDATRRRRIRKDSLHNSRDCIIQ